MKREKTARDFLEQQAKLDSLTGLSNRRTSTNQLIADWSKAQRTGWPLALILIDLDEFHQINQRFGHAAGDDALKQVSQVLKDSVGRKNFVGRWGGEEFLVIAPQCSRKSALILAERLRQAILNKPLKRQGESVRITASVGIAVAWEQGLENVEDFTIQDWINQADQALYAAKAAGRNSVQAHEKSTSPNPRARFGQFWASHLAQNLDLEDMECSYKILTMDDRAEDCRQSLRNETIHWLEAEDRVTSFTLAKNQKPDLILLNLDSSHFNGLDVLKTIKIKSETCSIPVIATSSNPSPKTRVEAIDAGAVEVWNKSNNPLETKACVLAHLRAKRLQDRLQNQAMLDGLTGLPNRRAIDAYLSHWSRLGQKQDQQVMGLLMVDLDHFKKINDQYGHIVGDETLQAVSACLRNLMRQSDFLGRLGGDEFVIVTEQSDFDQLLKLGESIRQTIESAQLSPSLITVSLGIAQTMSCNSLSISELMTSADQALHYAKQQGRKAIAVWSQSSNAPWLYDRSQS